MFRLKLMKQRRSPNISLKKYFFFNALFFKYSYKEKKEKLEIF